MSANNKQYWARRIKRTQDAIKDAVYKDARVIEREYDAAIRDIDTKIRAWYQRLEDNNGISYAEAQRLLQANELEEFHWTVQEYIDRGSGVISGDWAKQLENASARVHISRLDALKIEIQAHVEELAGKQAQITTDAVQTAFSESYYHTAYELQRVAGVGVTMQKPNTRTLETLLSKPWTADDQTFSDRIWTDKQKMVDTISKELTRMTATGAKPDTAIKNITHALDVSKSNAARVVMTESAYFASAAQKQCYADLDVERYEVIGTFDARMCDYCSEMNGKVFPMKDFKESTTAPPFHPWCRCCTAPYFEDMKDIGERWARDSETGKGYFVPSDMTYEEWKATQDAKYGEGAVDIARKKAYNKTKTNAESAVKLEKKIEEIRAEILEGKHNLTINQGNQDKHIVSSHSYKEELHKSIFYGDQTKAQEMVNEYHGTGKIKLTSKGEWAKKEFISVNEDVGTVFDAESQEYVKTKRFAIHYGKNGTHIVPVKGE